MSWNNEWIELTCGERIRKASIASYTDDYMGGAKIYLSNGHALPVGISSKEIDKLLGREDKGEPE